MLFKSEGLLWLLGSLCQGNRLPFDPQLILQNFPPPHTDLTLVEAGRALGFRIGSARFDPQSLAGLPLPCIAFLKTSAQAGTDSTQNPVFDAHSSPDADTLIESTQPAANPHDAPTEKPALILRVDKDRVLYFEQGNTSARTVALTQVSETFHDTCFLVARDRAATETPADPDAVGQISGGHSNRQRFGFAWFGRELLRHKSVWKNVLAASLAIQLIGLTTPLFTQVIIDKVVVHQTQSTLIVIASALVMFMAFATGMTWLRQYFVLHTGNRVDAVLGSQVFRHLLRLPMPYFEARPTGTLVARLHAVESIREFMAGAAVTLLLDLPFLVVFLAVMFFYSWKLSLIALALLGLIALASVLVTPAFRARLNRQFLLGARNQAFVTEYVSGIETVKSLQMEPRLEARYDDYLAAYLAAGFSTRQLSNTFNTIANALEQTMTLLILCVGALLVMQNDGFTVGMLVAFQMFASRMSQPMLKLAGLWQEFQQASIAMKRLGDVMDAPAEPWSLTPSRATDGAGRIEIEKLSFRYGEDGPLLYEGLDIAFAPGKLTVIAGASGSGKSTLAKLLLGFQQPTAGRILIDGRDIRHFSANELRQHYGVVPQETYLFSGSIYENLIAASPHAGFADIVRACKVAEVHEVIERLPQGYNTVIGEHGVGLSGGQKQRIAIARAILRRPKVLIFDEATANLDHRTAEQFARTVNQLKGQVTLIFIAHQLPKNLHVDTVIRLGEASHAPLNTASPHATQSGAPTADPATGPARS